MDYKAFVSSTFVDLEKHRAHVIRALRKAGFFVDPMEDWTSSADEPKEFSRQRLEGCHLCILLIARRRGYVPAGEQQSITQMEYDEARRRGIDVLPFLLDDDVPESAWKWDKKDKQIVQQWRAEVFEHFAVQTFKKTPSTLKIGGALTRWVKEAGPKVALRLYLEGVKQKHGAIEFVSLPLLEDHPNAPIQRLYVEPAVADRAVSPDVDPKEWPDTTPVLEAVANERRLVVLGDPGSGKSTLVSWIAWQLASGHDGGSSRWVERLGNLVPLPLILRELNIQAGITWDKLLDAFVQSPVGRLLTLANVQRLLEDGKAMIMLDGLDEIRSPSLRRELRDVVWRAMDEYSACRFLLTSRVVGYSDVEFDRELIEQPERKPLMLARIGMRTLGIKSSESLDPSSTICRVKSTQAVN